MATSPFQLYIDAPAVVSASRSGSAVTVTTAFAHGITTGSYVQLEGFTGTARMFARIADLQRALGEAVAALDEIAYRTPARGRPAAAKAAISKINQGIL